jgi:hypothetical protein
LRKQVETAVGFPLNVGFRIPRVDTDCA